ncbi:KAP family P-loop NTPase fold protein [Chrysiogenes arsenatis]|uniref:KAP family P-loop NTPase fold protein n=1 Tax=Chrysiogenes arsenatis TaxID=309797 RepID=UPI0003FA7395|nr:KAP family NTPase [Chrysiogenes arsenatis]
MTNHANYSSDAPISSPDKDRFSRWPFSKRISEVIAKKSDPSSIVIGLYGAWGDGKTTVLNFIEEALKTESNVICIRFNPWRYGTEEQLLEGFFHNIADALDTKLITSGEKVKDIIKKVAPAAAGALGQKGIGDGVAQFMAGPSLNELRSRIETTLEEAKKRVVILADDIDRLEKEEIHATFRLVKLTADFKFTSYILAFDEQVVSSALQDRYGAGVENAGKAFLEKIIQVPLNLPSVDRKILRGFCFEGVDSALTLAEIKLTEQQAQEFARNFTAAFDKRLKTPRKARMYGNILLFSLPILKGETNPVDVMLIEGVRVFFPKVYEVIKKNAEMFTGSVRDSYSSNRDKEKSLTIATIEGSIDSSDPEEIDGILSLLKSMFPKLEAVYGNTHHGRDWEQSWSDAQRICSPSYFQRYFAYAVPEDDISDQTIQNLIEVSSKDDLAETAKVFDQLLTTQNADRLIRKLRSKAKSISRESSMTLAEVLLLHSDRFPNPENLFNFNNPFAQAAMLVSGLIQNISDKGERISLSQLCIRTAPDIEFSVEIFRWLRVKDKDRPEIDGFTEDEISAIGKILAERIKSILESDVDITTVYPKICDRLLYQVKKYIGKSEVEEYLASIFKTSEQSVFRFLDTFTPTAWGMESGISRKSDLEREQYNSIVGLIDPESILSAITHEIGQLPSVSIEYPGDDKDRNQLLANQFLWLHDYVLKEQAKTDAENDQQ